MFKITDELNLSEIKTAIVEQGEEYMITPHYSSKSGKNWLSIKLRDGNLYAKQHATKNGNGTFFLCNEFEDSKGII